MYITTTHVNLTLHPSRVAKSSTSFGWGKGGKFTTAGWQVTLCDPMACDFRWQCGDFDYELLLTLLYLLRHDIIVASMIFVLLSIGTLYVNVFMMMMIQSK